MTASENMPSESQEEKVPWWTSCRFAICMVSFIGGICFYTMRISMSVAIVCMTFDRNNSSQVEENNETDTNYSTFASLIDNFQDFPSGKGQFDWSRTEVGLVLSAFYMGYFFTQMPGGILATTIGPKKIIGIGMLLQALLTLLTPPAAHLSVYVLMVLQVLKGIASGGYYPAYYQLWGKWAVPEDRAFLVSFSQSGTLIGSVVASVLSGYLCDHGFSGGWPSGFYIFGTASLLWCVVWYFMGFDSPSEHPRISVSELDYIQRSLPPDSDEKKCPVPWKPLLKTPALYAILVSDMCSAWSFYISLSYTPQYLNDILKIDILSNGLYSALPSLVYPVFTAVGGILADFIVRRDLIRLTWNRKLLQSLGLLPCAAISIWIGYLTASDKILAIVLLTLFGGLTGLAGSGSIVNSVDMAPRYSGIIMGIDNTLCTLSGILVPPITSAMTKNGTIEEWQTVFFVAAGITLVSWLAYVILADANEQEWSRQTDSGSISDTKGIENPTYSEEKISQTF